MAEAKTKEPDLFGDEGKVSLKYQAWKKIGDKVQGVLVEKRINTTPDKWGHTKAEYILMVDGERVCVQGRSYPKGQGAGTGHKVIFGMSDIPLGAEMGFVYDRDIPNDNGKPAKIVEPRYLGNRNDDVLKSYQEKFAGDTGESETPADDDTLVVKDVEEEDQPF